VSTWRTVAGRLAHHPGAVTGMALVALVALPALAAPVLPLPDPYVTDPAQRMAPILTPGHPLGTDHLGRDLLARLVWGARSSLSVGVLATSVAALLGSLIGLIAGFFSRWLDAALMRGIDVLMAFPYLLLALAIVAALGPGLGNAMLAIAVANIPFFARAVRGTVLGLKGQDFIPAARVAGMGEARILVRELVPNVVPTVLVMITTTLGWMILETAGLSFLGLGAQPPQADLGSMLGEGREFLTTFPRVATLPGVVILVTVIGINLLGDGLRDAIDPHRTGPAARSPVPRAKPVDHGAKAETLLTVRELTVRFPTDGDPVAAVAGVSFDMAAGERLALVGESGSGKTLTALALLRLVPPPGLVGGHVRLDGLELTTLAASRLRRLRGRRIAYIPQEPLTALDPLFPVGAQIAEAVRAHERIDRAKLTHRVHSLLDKARLPEPARLARRYPHELSGGMRQRAAIAMALAHEPDLIIADEATTALDVTVQEEILALLDRLCREADRALLFISHDLALVGRLCQRVMVLYAGTVVEDGPTATILERARHPYTRMLLACVPELGRPDKAFEAIPGQPPEPGRRPPGCRFAPRCPLAIAACEAGEPELAELAPGHRVRCIRADEVGA
jgi:peptide/nickel transport system permease protein